MVMKMTLCPFCMKETGEGICPHCGKAVSYVGDTSHLQAGYVLTGAHPYIFGAPLGQGGFGITYIALDMETNQRVAIKEYFPTFCARRGENMTVLSYFGQDAVYNKGKDRFLDEARVLKSLSDLKSIVNVLDFFELNNTAYLVMEFLEGDSLKSHALKNGKFPAQSFLQQMRPLMEDIERMHQRGVVHRDIAPDNIILTPDGQMKLIDFGAARSYVGDKSMTVVVKKGFAPIEQYMRHGSTAATDVYALAATVYYCITGVVPPDSAERQYDEDMLKTPISLGAELSKEQERALMKALEVQPKKRTQTVAELIKELDQTPKSEKPKKEEEVKFAEKKEKKKTVKWIIPAVASVILAIVGLFLCKEILAPSVVTDYTQITVAEIEEDLVPEVVNVLSNFDNDVPGIKKPFWGQSDFIREDVVYISFVYNLEGVPVNAVDVSAAKDGSILAWLTDGNLTVASNGYIALNPNSSSMFCNFVNLKHIDFGKYFDTTQVEDMSKMFYNCKSLMELDLSNFNTSRVKDMSAMFGYCESLQDVTLKYFDTHNVTDMNRMFYCCKNLSDLYLDSFDTSNVVDMTGMFGYCENLQKLDLTAFNTSQVTNMSQMFWKCVSVRNLNVVHFETSNVNDMKQMFGYCEQLETLDLGNLNTSLVINMNSMFINCKELEVLDLSGFDTLLVEE